MKDFRHTGRQPPAEIYKAAHEGQARADATRAKQTANAYIEPGGAPIPYERDARVSDFLEVARFVLWHDKNDMHGAVRRDEAAEALCRLVNFPLVNFPLVELKRVVREELLSNSKL